MMVFYVLQYLLLLVSHTPVAATCPLIRNHLQPLFSFAVISLRTLSPQPPTAWLISGFSAPPFLCLFCFSRQGATVVYYSFQGRHFSFLYFLLILFSSTLSYKTALTSQHFFLVIFRTKTYTPNKYLCRTIRNSNSDIKTF